ncbi:MAG: hypothetical protein ABSA03_20530 [Streptosporangiaceae bacterium]
MTSHGRWGDIRLCDGQAQRLPVRAQDHRRAEGGLLGGVEMQQVVERVPAGAVLGEQA